MYKLTLELKRGYELAFNPRKGNEIRKIFMNDTYWYPQKIEDKRFISLNISSADTLKNFIPLALSYGNIFGAFPINDDDVCYVYSGSISSNRVSASFGLRPLFAGRSRLSYFFPDEDFKNIICQDIKAYIQDLLTTEYSDPISLTYEDLKALKELLTTPISTNLDPYSRFFEIYCDDRCVKAHLSHEEPCEYCTAKVGLHPLLHVVKLVPSEVWIKEHHRDLFVYLLHQDFLVGWTDIAELNETRQKRILSGIKGITPEINRFNFKVKVKNIVKNLVNKHDIFTILYFLSRYEGGSATLKKIFDNLFYLLPKETGQYLTYPKFQPKLFIDGLEMHFILLSETIGKIYQMRRNLREIFDEVDFFRVGIYEPKPHLRRYRFICKANREGQYIDYMDLPNIIEDTGRAIITLVKQNKLEFVEEESRMKESWLKRINLKIVTPPQFETATLEAFSKRWVLQRKVSKDIELVYLFTIDDSDENFGKNVDRGVIPKELKNGLKTKGSPLSKNARIEKEKNNVWRIIDDEKIFIANKSAEWVDIYVKIKGKIVSADVFCDYTCLVDQEAKFNFFRDVQANYARLNRLLEEDFNFKMFR